MFLAILTMLTALTISAVAIYYSVAGLAAIFAAAVVPIVIMGSVLEVAKLVTAVWLHRFWSRSVWWLKTYLSMAVFVLMLITSMGIFGFLSKAHIEQTATAGDNSLQIELLDNRIAREQKRIVDADLVISQLDQAVQTLIDYDRIRGPQGSIAVREGQKEERDALNGIITEAQNNIAKLQDERLILSKQQVAIEAEVGPIKYIAEFVYGEEANKNLLEEAVRWVIIVIIFVFDPLAVLLLIASQYTFQWRLEDGSGTNTTDTESNAVIQSSVAEDSNESNSAQSDTGDNLHLRPERGTGTDTDSQDQSIDITKQYYGVDFELEESVPSAVDDAAQAILESYSKKKEITEEQQRTQDYAEKEANQTWQVAKKTWKEQHPNETLKEYKTKYIRGQIDELPWEAGISYVQNAEQGNDSIWQRIKKDQE